jgi:hypothetical protein
LSILSNTFVSFLGKEFCPKPHRKGRNHFVIVIYSASPVTGFGLLYLVHVEFQQPACICLVDNPIRIGIIGPVMLIDGIPQHDFKQIQYATKPLA